MNTLDKLGCALVALAATPWFVLAIQLAGRS